VFGAKYNAEEKINAAHAVLKLIEEELAERQFIAQPRPTIADVALYSYISRAPEGNVDISGYSNIGSWLRRIEQLPGFVAFKETPVGLSAKG
jgi:glutathione S-transferase